MTARRFLLQRHTDVTGISGTGTVAEGVQFTDGTVVVRWLDVEGPAKERGVCPTTVVFPSIEAVVALHGHGGATTVEWYDAFVLSGGEDSWW